MKKLLKRKKLAAALALYALYALCWLALALFFFIGDGMKSETALDLDAAALHELANPEPGVYVSEGVDPQLVFEGLGQKVRTVRLSAQFKYAPGEMELFYTREPGEGFSLRRRVIGVPQDDGSTLYSLPPGRVEALRIDPGSGGNEIKITGITLNPRRAASAYFVPGLRALLGFAALPVLALCVIYTIIEWVTALGKARDKRRKSAGN